MSFILKRYFNICPVLLSLFLCITFLNALELQGDIERLDELLKLAEKAPGPEDPPQGMYSRNQIIYCTGKDMAAQLNNYAAGLMEQGDYKSAREELLKGLKKAPLFFPFRYNIGICYIYTDNLKLALLNLEKAKNVFPEYYNVYLQIGYVYERLRNYDTAIIYYRKALNKNKRHFQVYVLIGDIYIAREQLEMAGKYYQAALDIEPKIPNAMLGQAKIHYIRKEYYPALVIMQLIPLKEGYDKSLHYYYGECAYKLRRYRLAYEQYSTLLKYKNDKFFLTTSVSLVEHKIDLCKRFMELEDNIKSTP